MKAFRMTCIFFVGFICTSVDGRACFQDPKVYVVKMPREQQILHLLAARKECIKIIQDDPGPKEAGKHCNGTFDGIMCWPHTRAGITAKQPCPNYINKFYTRGFAIRQCMPNGEWYVNPNTSNVWTDYNPCMVDPPSHTHKITMDNITRIQLMYRIGYGVSLASLVVAIFLMIWFKKLRCHRNTIHINLFISFALRAVVIFIKDSYLIPEGLASTQNDTAIISSTGSNWLCKLVNSVFNYLLVANYMWIFNEGLYLHTLIFISPFKSIKIFYFCVIFGWCSPLLCVIPWAVVRRYLEDTLCWSTHDPKHKFNWIIRGPIVVSVVVNFVLFVNFLRVLFTKIKAVQKTNPHRYRRLARSTLVLIPMFGVYYMLTVAMPDCFDENVEIVWLYFESGINSFQGLLIALLFCFLNGEVKAELAKRWNRHMLRRLSTVSLRSSKTMFGRSAVFTKDKPSPDVMCTDHDSRKNLDLKSLNGNCERQNSTTYNSNEHEKSVTIEMMLDENRPMITSSI